MKKRIVLAALASLSVSPLTFAQDSWWDSLKNMLGMDDNTEQSQQAPVTVEGLVAGVASQLGITEQQARQGLASIMTFLKTTAESAQFADLKTSLPGIEALLAATPEVAQTKSEGLIGGLLDKASELSPSVKALNDLKKQFESLELKPEMIQDFVKTAQSYLDTPEGQDAKQKLEALISSLLPEN